jgi:chromosome transmission fidelity protein 18
MRGEQTTHYSIIIKNEKKNQHLFQILLSDDRSVDSFKTNIESVTQTRGSVNETDMKPSCLIIDEIDGAPQVTHFG